jgi:prefoldin subunit 5
MSDAVERLMEEIEELGELRISKMRELLQRLERFVTSDHNDRMIQRLADELQILRGKIEGLKLAIAILETDFA